MLLSDNPYDFRSHSASHKQKSCPCPPGPPYDRTPGSSLPVYPTYSWDIINGVKYKTYFETSWTQVLTEDGVSLRDLLRSLPIYSEESFYRYRGILRNRPNCSAIDQLYNLPSPRVGDVWLVETNWVDKSKYVYEVYSYTGLEAGWVVQGTTNRNVSVQKSLSNVLQLMPSELGEADQFLIVGKDGKSITWGDPIRDHNEDTTAHPDIRKMIEDISITATKIQVFNDILKAGDWTYNSSNGYYEYVLTNQKIPVKAYFEITPVIETKEMSRVIAIADMNPVYQVCAGADYSSYAVIRSKHVPTANIPVCIKVLGAYECKCDCDCSDC